MHGCHDGGARTDQPRKFATKPALTREMITRALDSGAAAPWVAGDEVYGSDPALRNELEDRGVGYVLAVACSHPVTTAAGKRRADALAASLRKHIWQRVSAGPGSKGPRFYHDPAVAISVAGETPVTLTHDAVARLREHLDWAVAEHQQLLLRTDEAADTGSQYEQFVHRYHEPATDNDGNARPAETVTNEMQRNAQRQALALIEVKKPTDRIDFALFYLQISVGRYLTGNNTRDDLAWHHEVAQELANLTDEEIAESKHSEGRQ